MDFPSQFKELTEISEGWIRTELTSWDIMSGLEEACSYSLLAPGKRFRPVLAIAVARMLGLDIEQIKGYSIALEFVHTFSLVHDDLPALDNDSIRRGQPSAYVKFGEAVALLAGDALLARAFAILSKDSLAAEIRGQLIELLSESTLELCRGQYLDLHATKSSTLLEQSDGAEELHLRHMQKTAALISAAVVGPSYLLETGNRREIGLTLRKYGENLGLLFQITDDILDVISTSEVLGKTAGTDAEQGTPLPYQSDRSLRDRRTPW